MNILIADDEIDTLNEINFYVKKYKKFDSVIMCTNSLDALDKVKAGCFDIALLDIEMPGMSGLELAKRFLNIDPHIKIAFITAYNSYATEAFDVNAIDYVLKPIREERLIKALDRLINRKENFSVKKDEPKIHIQTFNKLIIKIGDDIIKWNRRKSFELFAYLLENKGKLVHKGKLCDLLWPDFEPKKALVNLQSTVYSIRKTLKKYDNDEINIKYIKDNYILNIKNASIDIAEFKYTLKRALELHDVTLLKKALSMYKGDYLEEEGWLWTEPIKIKMRNKYKAALKKLEINMMDK